MSAAFNEHNDQQMYDFGYAAGQDDAASGERALLLPAEDGDAYCRGYSAGWRAAVDA